MMSSNVMKQRIEKAKADLKVKMVLYLMLPMAMFFGIMIADWYTDNTIILFFEIIGIAYGVFFIESFIKKAKIGKAFKSGREMKVKLFMILVKSVILSTSAITWIALFLIGQVDPFQTIDGILYMNVTFAIKYMMVYSFVYLTIVLITVFLSKF